MQIAVFYNRDIADGQGQCVSLMNNNRVDSLIDIEVTRSEVDGTLIIQIDTPTLPEDSDGPQCRIYLNDHCLHENPKFPVTASKE